MSYCIETKDLFKRYNGARTPAVDSLDLKIDKGTIYGILGPNGAGKTTTLSMLSGLLKPDRGEILFGGKVLKDAGMIGYIPQELAIYDKLSALDNLRFFGRLYGLSSKRLEKKTSELLGMIGLENRAKDLVSKYSHGMKRRLNLAAGLLHSPELILMDEPTVGIDPQSRNRIFEAIEEINRQGRTVLYTTHYMEEAMRLCHHIAIMDSGKIIVQGEPEALVKEKGTYRIVFEVEGSVERIAENLKKIDGVQKVSKDDELLRIRARVMGGTINLVSEVKKMIEDSGSNALLKSITEPTLESLFLDLTGRTLRDDV